MKKDIHPELHEVSAHCACGKVFLTRSTSSDINVTLCSNCHPYYTGAQKYVDIAGRIEKFQKKFGAPQEAKPKAEAKETKAKSTKSSKK